MEDQTFTDQHLLLETPANKNNLKNLGEKSQEAYRAAEYSDNQRKEMEKSIINRSTNKKVSRRQKFNGSTLNKLEKKNIESSRAIDNTIKEEPVSINLSDDE